MRLVPEWKRVLRYAWSIRLIVLAAVLGAIELALPLFSDAFPRNVFTLLSIAVSIGAAVARFVAQDKSMGRGE